MKMVMRKLFVIPVIASLVFACNPKSAEEAKTGEAKKAGEASGVVYELAADGSVVHWRGTKPGGEHVGVVSVTKGEAMVDNGTVTGGSITIDLNSIENFDLQGDMNARLVGHLKSEDFFYTEQYPTAVFEIVSAEAKEGAAPEGGVKPTHEITGNLTMRGVTKSIVFPASISVTDGKVKAVTNEFAVDRTLWGVNFKSKSVFAEFKDDFIGDMINLKFDVEFKKN
jgi:polyisoprenoid-binding protein YceI